MSALEQLTKYVEKLKKLQSDCIISQQQFQHRITKLKNNNDDPLPLFDDDESLWKKKYEKLQTKYNQDIGEILEIHQQCIVDRINDLVEILIEEFNHQQPPKANIKSNSAPNSGKNKKKRLRECSDRDQTSTKSPPRKRQKLNSSLAPNTDKSSIHSIDALNKNEIAEHAYLFKTDQDILCYDTQNMIYEAKVIEFLSFSWWRFC